MKVLFSLLMTILSVVPCQAKEAINVVTTTADLASILKAVGKEKVEVVSLSKGSQDPHFIEVRPSQVVKLKDADLLVLVGMDLDIWVEALIDASRNSKIKHGKLGYLDCSVDIEKLDVPLGKIDASMGHLHIYGNPHYWLDPLNAKIIAYNIAERLCEISPQNETYFKQNLAEFNQKIDAKMIEWKEKLKPFKGQKIAIYHRSWLYFANRFGLVVACELEPKPGIPPSFRHLKEVIDIIKKEKIKVILMEVFYDEKPARFVAEQTGANVVIVPNSVGGTKEARDYFSLIDTIVDELVKVLEK